LKNRKIFGDILAKPIQEITCQSALHQLKRKIPYGWDLNLYRGCAHNCIYCYARYTHDYLGNADFDQVYVKTNILEHLEAELSSPTWKREVVNIGGVTDSYQPAEAKYKLMPEVLKLLIKYKTPAIISTKSNLIMRDYDLIAELAELTYINIAATITTMDEADRIKLEPHASPSQERFEVLQQFRKTNASVGLHTMPIIPHITDSYDNIERLCEEAQKAKVHYMLPGVLYLRGTTRQVFFDFVQKSYPDLYAPLRTLYKTGGADKEYKDRLYSQIVNPLRQMYGISNSYMRPMKEKMGKY